MEKKKSFSFSMFLKSLKDRSRTIITLSFIITVIFVLGVAIVKNITSETSHVYAKVKVSQGLWWASTQKPSLWYIESIQKDGIEYGLLGKPIAEILGLRYYPTIPEGRKYETQYNVYLTVKLTVDYNNKTKRFTFKRSPLAVGSPIELNFPSSQITGTVIEISQKELQEKYTEKIVFLTKRLAFPWEYQAIQLGDNYFDGEDIVFEVLGKNKVETSMIAIDSYGNLNPNIGEARNFITVKGKVKLKEKNNQLIYGGEQIVKPGAIIDLTTSNFVFDGFVIQSIEDISD